MGRGPPRRLPRSDPRARSLERRAAERGRADAGRGAVRRLRRVHQLRQPGRAEVQHRGREGGRRRGRRRHPLRLHPPAGRAHVEHGLPRPAREAGGVPRRLPRRDRARAPRHRRLRRRVGLRSRSHAARGGGPGHPGHGARDRLHRADALPVALGARGVRRRQPERRAVRDHPPLAAPTSSGRPEAPAPGWCRGCRTSRSASTMARPRCAPRSGPRATSASRSGCSGTRSSRTPRTALARNAHGAKLPAPRAQTATPPAPAAAPGGRAKGAAAVRANELGSVPVIMYHQIRADGGGDYDLTPAEFRAELARLHREGYRPIRADRPRARRASTCPAGKTPVVLTFDDSTKEQLAYDADGDGSRRTPRSASCSTSRARTRTSSRRARSSSTASRSQASRRVTRCSASSSGQGFEIGNHTHDHIPLNQKDDAGVQQALVMGQRIIKSAVPRAPRGHDGAPARRDCLRTSALARRGSWGGESYRHDGVFLVGRRAGGRRRSRRAGIRAASRASAPAPGAAASRTTRPASGSTG